VHIIGLAKFASHFKPAIKVKQLKEKIEI